MAEDRLLDLVSGLYAAAAEPALWPEALRAVADALDSRSVNLFVVDRASGEMRFNVYVDIPRDRIEEYNGSVVTQDPRVRYALAHPERTITFDHLHTPEAEIDRDPYYAWLAAEDFRYYVAAQFHESRYLIASTVQRTARQGHAGATEIELMARLAPHFRRALALSLKLGGLEAQARAGADAAEALPWGVVVLDERGGVLHMNREARRIVETGGVLRAGADGLRCVRAADDARLQRLIAGALATALGLGGESGGAMRLPRPDSPRHYTLQVMPLTGDRPLFALDWPASIVFVADPERRPTPPAERLRALWGLTPREARLALLVLEGLGAKQAAERMGVAESTARIHLAAVFRKTGARRQAELVKLLVGSVMGLTP